MFGIFKKSEGHVLNNPVAVEFQYGDETVRLETGRYAKQVTGAIMATMGGTMVWQLCVLKRQRLKVKISSH